MKEIEYKIVNLILDRLKRPWPEGELKCSATRGSVGYTGAYKYGLFKKETADITELFRDYNPASANDDKYFPHLLSMLREASKTEEYGPFYRCNISFKGKKFYFKYFWENEPTTSLHDIEKDTHGALPNFIFERVFSEELIANVKDYEIDVAIFTFVPACKNRDIPISSNLMEMYALLDWQSDTVNGGLNQYFARDTDYFGCFPRSELYPLVPGAISAIGHEVALSLYKEAIALYSHFYDRVEDARQQMEIQPVEKQEKSDINDRYFQFHDELEENLRKHIKQRAAEYAVRS